MKVTFIRHGETTLNKANKFSGRIDCELTEEAILKTKEVAFKKGEFDCVYISPLKRTKQTADLIYPYVNAIVSELILDRDLGELSGKSKYCIEDKKLHAFRNDKYLPKGCEKKEDVEKRVKEFIDFLKNKHTENDKILVVSHSGVIRIIKKNYTDNPNLFSKNLEGVTINC